MCVRCVDYNSLTPCGSLYCTCTAVVVVAMYYIAPCFYLLLYYAASILAIVSPAHVHAFAGNTSVGSRDLSYNYERELRTRAHARINGVRVPTLS